jgi:hypothetical protein
MDQEFIIWIIRYELHYILHIYIHIYIYIFIYNLPSSILWIMPNILFHIKITRIFHESCIPDLCICLYSYITYLWIYICIHIHIYSYTYSCTNKQTNMYIYIYIKFTRVIHESSFPRLCVCSYIYNVFMYACMYVWLCIDIHVQANIYLIYEYI